MAPASAGARALQIALGAYISGVNGRVVSLPLDASSPVYHKGIDGIAELGKHGTKAKRKGRRPFWFA